MAEHHAAEQTDVPQDGASRIIRKLDSIEKKLTLLLWFVGLPVVLMIVWTVLGAVIGILALV